MRTLNARELQHKMHSTEPPLLINVLDADAFEEEHIPGSKNVPVTGERFVEEVTALAERKDRSIVVYCASKDCTASPTAAKKLADAGFTDVADFEGGMAEWKLAGFEVEQATHAR